jgi:methionine-rich copper-binding protein CopC
LQSHWDTITAKKPTDNLQTCGDGFYSIRYPCRYDEFAWTNLTSTDPGNAITLADTIIDFKDSTQIELSLWLNIDPIKPAFPYLTITLVNQTNNEVFTDEIHPKQMASTFMNRLRVSYNRKLGHGTYQLKLLVHADKVLLGNVLIREADVHIKQILKENEYIDNYPIREQ